MRIENFVCLGVIGISLCVANLVTAFAQVRDHRNAAPGDEALTVAACDAAAMPAPPAGAGRAPIARRGYEWTPGHYRCERGGWTWQAGYWSRARSTGRPGIPTLPDAVPLTIAECINTFGGTVVLSSSCATGHLCVRESPSGQLYDECISEIVELPSGAGGGNQPVTGEVTGEQSTVATQPPEDRIAELGGRRTSSLGGVQGERATVASPLTAGECRRLGGEVRRDWRNVCSRADEICYVQWADGSWHGACINEPG